MISFKNVQAHVCRSLGGSVPGMFKHKQITHIEGHFHKRKSPSWKMAIPGRSQFQSQFLVFSRVSQPISQAVGHAITEFVEGLVNSKSF